MHAGSTLFLDVCLQHDFWPGGAWPLVRDDESQTIAALCAAAARIGIRQGGVMCLHDGPPVVGAPMHCRPSSRGAGRPSSCAAGLAVDIRAADDDSTAAPLDRGHATYVTSGCTGDPDTAPFLLRVFDHLTAGVRDAVVFGAGLEYGIDRVIAALLRRRIRTHVALDASAAADPAAAQRVIAEWKRRTVDVTTAATMVRLLSRT